MDSYSQKRIIVRIQLNETGQVLTFDGFAVRVQIKKQGLPELPSASVQLYGLSEDHLAQLTMLGWKTLYLSRNQIEITAGDVNGMSLAFRGEICTALPDFNSAPSPVLNIEAISGVYGKTIPASPVAVSGQTSAASLCEGFARQAGMTFKNEGVTASVSDCVINGDPVSKMRWVADSVGADLLIDDQEAILAPRDKPRGELMKISAINPQTGEIGYPSFDNQGIQVKCFYRPDLLIGGWIEVDSMLPRATGNWRIYSISHDISANLPSGGTWSTSISGTWW